MDQGFDAVLPPVQGDKLLGTNSGGTGLQWVSTGAGVISPGELDTTGATLYDHIEYNGSAWYYTDEATYAGDVQINADLGMTGDLELTGANKTMTFNQSGGDGTVKMSSNFLQLEGTTGVAFGVASTVEAHLTAANFRPNGDGGLDLGQNASTNRWKDLFLSGDADIAGALDVDGDVTVNGNVNLVTTGSAINLWNDTGNYSIDMNNTYSYGAVLEAKYSTVFTQRNVNGYGWIWRNDEMGATQAAMSLEKDGDLTVAGDGTFGGEATVDGRAANHAYFGHKNFTSTTSYAIRQNTTGNTAVNANSGQFIDFLISNSAASGFRLNSDGTTDFYDDVSTIGSLTVGPNAVDGALTAWEFGNSIFVLDNDARLYLQGTSTAIPTASGSAGAAIALADVADDTDEKVFVIHRNNRLGAGQTWFKTGNDSGLVASTFWFMKFDAAEEEIHMNLPTSNPGGDDIMWNDGGTVKIT